MDLQQYSIGHLANVWRSLDTPILHVLEHGGDDAVNVGNALVRHLGGQVWLYVDDSEGYSVVDSDDVSAWAANGQLCETTDPRCRNVWDGQGNVLRDGVVIGRAD